MASAERKRGGGAGGGKKTGPALHRKAGKEQRRRHSAMNRSQGGARCWQINPPQTGRRGGDGRESEGASQQRSCLSVVSGFVASSNCSSPRPSSLVPPGFDRSIGRNVTGPRHSRQSWWVRFLWDGGGNDRGRRDLSPLGLQKPADINVCRPNTEMLFSLHVKNWLYAFKKIHPNLEN